MSMCHRVGAGAVQWGRGGEAGWPAAPPGRLQARAAPATLLARHPRRARAGPSRSALRSLAPHNALTASRAPRPSALASRATAARPPTCATDPDCPPAPSARSRPRHSITTQPRLSLTNTTPIACKVRYKFGYVSLGGRRSRAVSAPVSLRNAYSGRVRRRLTERGESWSRRKAAWRSRGASGRVCRLVAAAAYWSGARASLPRARALPPYRHRQPLQRAGPPRRHARATPPAPHATPYPTPTTRFLENIRFRCPY